MKQIILLSLMLNTGCALASPPSTKFSVHVTNVETGLPISNAVVRTGFTLKYDPWGNEQNEYDNRKEGVNADGLISFEGETIRDERGGTVFADGYYSQRFGMKYKKNIALNRWEPWNPTIEVKLRPKKNPVPMVQKYIEWKPIPNIGGAVGYDLEVGDWVSPHGKGKISDLILTTSSYFQEGQKGSEARYTLSFSNEFDGIQVYRYPEDLHSSFKWPYQAPMEGYRPTLEKFRHWDVNGMPDKSNYDEKNNYTFRVRSRQLEDGSVEACYGMIEGEVEYIPQGKIRFSYWFNPVPNERSLEYNGVNLLKKK
jgi:hypothetical protein